MVVREGSRLSGSIQTPSMAPGAALIPCLMCAPSKAGPEAQEQATMRSLSPTTISVLVPMSIKKQSSSDLWTPVARMDATQSAPTNPAMSGRTCIFPLGFPRLKGAESRSLCPRSFGVKGLRASGRGSKSRRKCCMAVFPTNTSSYTSHGSASTFSHASTSICLMPSTNDLCRVSRWSPPPNA